MTTARSATPTPEGQDPAGAPWDALTRIGRLRRHRRLAKAALHRYDIEPRRIRLIASETNVVYRVDGEAGSWILRIGHAGPIEHPVEQVRSEAIVLRHLADLGLPVPRPFAGVDGEDVQRVSVPTMPRTHSCVVFERVPGRVVGDRLGISTARRYGRLAAEVHAGLRSFAPGPGFRVASYDRPFPFEEPVVLFDGPRSLISGPRKRIFSEARDRVAAGIERLRSGAAPQLVHGDLHIWNILVHGSRLHAIDFEDLMWGWPVQDIATTLYYIADRPDYAAVLAAFRRGYEAHGSWPDEEDIALFLAGRALVLANDVTLLQDDEDLDAAAFFDRAERRIRRWLG